jgi:hypothetical protein
MSTLFEHIPHPRIAQRRAQGPPKVADQMPKGSPLARFNTRFGLAITIAVGSMWAAYLFTLLALVSLPSAIKSHDKIIIISWIAQTFLQLVLLPIIIVGQNVQAAAADKRAQATYDDADAVLHTALEIQQHLHAQDDAILLILDHLGIAAPPTRVAGAGASPTS